MKNKVDWKERFIELSKYIAGWSKDNNTGVGAVITDNDNTILSIGYNGFPRGLNDDIEERRSRPLKYLYTEHAERNAIYNAARSNARIKGGNMFVMRFPCANCARAIIQVGIKNLVCPEPDMKDDKWGEEFKVSKEMLDESDVNIEFYSPKK